MADEITIVVRAEDAFSSVLGNFGNIMTGIKSTIDLVAGAFNTVKDFAGQFVDAAAESEVVTAKFNATLNATGGIVGMTSKDFQNLATAMQDQTGFSDEAELAAEGMLLRFENLKSIFPDVLKLTNDYAIALGVDLTTAAQTMGKALDDPASGIGKLNMQFKLFDQTEMDNIKTMAAHGDVAGAQAIIMETLRQKVGDVSDAYANTFAGSLAIAKEKLDNLKELIGGPIISLLQTLLTTAMNFVETNPIFQTIVGFFQQWNDLLNNGAPMLTALGASLINLSPALYDVGVAMLGLQQAFDQGTNTSAAFQHLIDTLTATLGTFAQSIVNSIINSIVNTDWGAITDAMDQKLADVISSHDWTSSGNAFGQALAKALSSGTQAGIDSEGSTAIPAIAKALSDWFLGAAGVVSWSQFKDVFLGILNQFVLQPVIDWVKTNWYKIFLPMIPTQAELSAGYSAWKNLANQMIAGLMAGLDSLEINITDWVRDNIVTPVKLFLGISSPSTVFAQIGKDIITGFINGIDSMVDWATNAIKSLLATILAPFKSILAALGIDVSDIFGTSSGGTTGGGSSNMPAPPPGGTTPTPSGTGTSTVNYNFYGPVYMSGVPAEGSYDCPPNTVIQASSNQITVPGY